MAQLPIDLKEFVHQTILDVLKGIAEAQRDAEVGARVAPALADKAVVDPSFGVGWHDDAMWSVMKFDVAITVQKSTETGGGAKGSVKIAVVEASLGADGKNSRKNETISRIQFAVPYVVSKPRQSP